MRRLLEIVLDALICAFSLLGIILVHDVASGLEETISTVAFVVFGADKKMARQGTWRIPERTLFTLALLGGSPGAIIGMLVFHHKTKHMKFVIGLPTILVLESLLILAILVV